MRRQVLCFLFDGRARMTTSSAVCTEIRSHVQSELDDDSEASDEGYDGREGQLAQWSQGSWVGEIQADKQTKETTSKPGEKGEIKKRGLQAL